MWTATALMLVIFVCSACDNLAIHPTKRGVLTACHPKMLTFTLYAQHVFAKAPSQVRLRRALLMAMSKLHKA